MLTDTDIPPGGEGKIEVTFDSKHKTGQQKKSITVESNDPKNPRATLNITAFVEIVFGFEQYSLDVGRVRKGKQVSISTSMIVKDPSIAKTVAFTSSSPQFSAKVVQAVPGSGSTPGRLTIEVHGTSDIPVGRINAALTARAGDGATPDATLPITGTVVGNVDITPEAVQFFVDTSKTNSESVKQVVKVISTVDGAQVHILSVKDVDQRLMFHVDTLVADKQYEVTLVPIPAVMKARTNVSGAITITTDDKEQPETPVTYWISFGR